MVLSDVLMLITIALYMSVMVIIGIYFTKKNTSSDDFYLGGRKLGPFVTAMSAEASDMSSYGCRRGVLDGSRTRSRYILQLAYSR